jgi:hypothetical protein
MRLKALKIEMAEEFEKVVVLLGEDPSTSGPEEFFGTLFKYSQDYEVIPT